MASPFQDIYDTQQPVPQGEAGTSPFDDVYGTKPQQVVQATTSPDGTPAAPESPGPAAIAAADRQNRANNKAKVEDLLKSTTLSLAERDRLEKMRDDLDDPEFYNRVTDHDRSVVENVGRGLLHGVVNYGILGTVDVGLAAAEIALPKPVERVLHLDQTRGKVADLQESFKEVFDPQGKAAAIATVAGSLVGGAKGFAYLDTIGFKLLSKVLPPAAKVVAKGLAPGATFLERYAAHAIGSGAVNAVMAVDVLSRDDLSPREKLKAFATVVGLSMAGAAWGARKLNKGEAPTLAEKAEQPQEGDLPDAGGPSAGEKEADAAIAKITERKALQKATRTMRFQARVDWEKANPGKDWDALTKDERKVAYDERAKKETAAQAAAPIGEAPSQAAEPAGEVPVAPDQGIVKTTSSQDAAQSVVVEAAKPPEAQASALPVVELPAPVPVSKPPKKSEAPIEASGAQRSLEALKRDFGDVPLHQLTPDELQVFDDHLENIIESTKLTMGEIKANKDPVAKLYNELKDRIQKGFEKQTDPKGQIKSQSEALMDRIVANPDDAEAKAELKRLNKVGVDQQGNELPSPITTSGAAAMLERAKARAAEADQAAADAVITRGEKPPEEGPALDKPKNAEAAIPETTAKEAAKPPKQPKAEKPAKGARTLEDIDADIDKIDDALDAKTISDAQATVRLEKLKREKLALKKAALLAPVEGVEPAAPAAKTKMPDTVGNDLSKFSPEQLSDTKRAIKGLVADPANAGVKDDLIQEFARIAEFETARDRPPPAPVTLNMSPSVVGGVVGFFGGYTQGNDDQERLKNALYYGAAGLMLGYGLSRKLRTAAEKAVPEYQKEIRKTVQSIEDRDFEKREGIMQRFRRIQRNWYAGTVRRSIGIEDATKAIGRADAPFFKNPGKMAELFGLSKHMADSWIFDKPRYWDDFSEVIDLGSAGIQEIVLHNEGDMRSIGDLMASRRALELAGQPKPRRTGISLAAAQLMLSRAGTKLFEASEMAREYGRALGKVGELAQLLSPATVAKWDVEYYAPMRKLFHGEVGTTPSAIDTKGTPTKQQGVAANQPFKKLKGGNLPMQNPMEALVDLTPRILRAAEFNRLATVFFDGLAEAHPEVRKLIARPRISPSLPTHEAMASRLGKYVDEAGGTISKDEAMQIVHTMSDHTLNVTDDIVHFYRAGKRESWQVAEPVARAFRSLQGHEIKALMEGLELPAKVAEIARVGVTVNPWFIVKQAFRDNWQFYMNGIYGTTPVYSNLKAFFYQGKGWWEIVKNADEAKLYSAFGGGGDTIADQGLQIIRGKVGLLEQIRANPANNRLELAVQQLKRMSIFEAYTTLAAPIADAGRIGAYLHERGRGLKVAEAVYNAKKAGANYNQKGDWAAIQALNKATLFMNASIQSFDAAKDAFTKSPVAYITRAITGITIPSVLLWLAYRDDPEIQEVRGTAAGKRAWPVRIGGKIVLVPKTQFDGHIWGTSVEAWLDKKYNDDPEAIHAAASALFQDMAVNMMPTIGVVPVSIWNNVDLNQGGPIVGGSNADLDIEYQYKDRTSTLARVTSKLLAPAARSLNIPAVNTAVSPAGLDYLVRNLAGTLGTEVASTVSFIMDLHNGAGIPPGDELPFVSSAFGHQPSLNAGSISEFYNQATTAAQKAATLQHLASSDPDKLDLYIEANQNALALAPMYAKVRGELADMRKAIVDIKEAPPDVMSPDEKREVEKELLTQMIETAKAANQAARQMEKERVQ